MATTVDMTFRLIGKDVSASKSVQNVSKGLGKVSSGIEKHAAKITAGAAAAAAAIVAYGASAVKAASEDAQAASVLAQTLKNTTGARDDDIASIEDWIGQVTLATGVADDELRPALANLARGSGDLATAQDQLTVAMDAAAATGKPLAAITEAMMKAQTGNIGALGRLGIATKDATGKTKTFAQVYAGMADQFSGAQAAKTDTAAGKMQVMQNAFDEATESVGYGLLPILTQLADFMTTSVLPVVKSVTDWMSQNGNAAKVLGGALAGLVAIIVAVNTATKIATAVTMAWKVAVAVATAVQWLWNVALTANPIGLIVAAIALFVGALVALYQKNETVRKVIDAVWDAIKTAIGFVIKWFQNTAWPIIRKVIDFIVAYYSLLWKAVRKVWDGIKSAIGAVVGWFQETAWPKIKVVAELIGGVWDGIAAAAKAAFNFIANAWNNTVGKLSFTIPDWVPGIGGKGFDIPDIPLLANGGIVTKPTLAVVGESGPEAVIPLNRRGFGGAAPLVGTLNVDARGATDPSAVERAVARALEASARRLAVI